MVYPIVRYFIPPFFKLWIKKIEGAENIPRDKAFIMAANHQSYFETIAIPCVICLATNKKLHHFVNRDYFRNPLMRWFLSGWGGSIPVDVSDGKDRKEVNEKAFKLAISYLKNKEPIGIYPEGHRSPDGRLQKARTGAAKLALTAKVPILPIGVQGAYELLPKGKRLPRFKKLVIIKIGKPMGFERYYGKEHDPNVLEQVTREIMQQIGRLIKQTYPY